MTDRREWMWAQALDALTRAERLHQQFFRPSGRLAPLPSWEPPLDVLETEREVVVMAALPGVPPEEVSVRIEGAELIIEGERRLPGAVRTAVIHRMELPLGRFERRLALPRGIYHAPRLQAADGCLIVSIAKAR
jgi:HSP20 family molecular chaperone IbpA